MKSIPPTVRRVLLQHYRIDDHYSNAYTAWKEMGSPQEPTPEQYARLQAAGQLQLLDSPAVDHSRAGRDKTGHATAADGSFAFARDLAVELNSSCGGLGRNLTHDGFDVNSRAVQIGEASIFGFEHESKICSGKNYVVQSFAID